MCPNALLGDGQWDCLAEVHLAPEGKRKDIWPKFALLKLAYMSMAELHDLHACRKLDFPRLLPCTCLIIMGLKIKKNYLVVSHQAQSYGSHV